MDSSPGSESDEILKPRSRDSGRISSRNVEIEITSTSSSDRDRDRDSFMRLEMDLFTNSQYSAATSSYSSSDKYSEDYFRLMPSDATKTDKDVMISHENSDDATVTTSSSSTEPTSMVSDITHESLIHGVSPARSPPSIQVMDRSGGYQPGRIPLSVFERGQASTPVEWSIASNESLFSIHIGNMSFSRDRFIMLAGDLKKSGELPKFDEAIATSQPPEYNDASDGSIVELERNFRDNETAAGKLNSDSLKEENGRTDPIVTRMPSLNNEPCAQFSTIPVTKAKKKKKKSACSCPKPSFRWLRTICCWTNICACRSCSCSGCNPTYCRCSWPSCHCQCPSFSCKCTPPSCDCSCLTCCFKRPSCCSCCSWSSCCNWSCCSGGCCCSSCFPSKKSAVKSKSSSSCWSCHSCDPCCACSGCCTLSFSCNPCCSLCFGCRRKCRCCC